MKQIATLVVVLVVIAGIAFMLERRSENAPVACTLEAKLCPDGSAVGRTGPNCEFAACPGPRDTDEHPGATLYDDFNQATYDVAVASNTLVVLYFHATWCPICAKEWPEVQAAFETVGGLPVVGFRVNFNDNETDAAEQALAREFGVAYQHTKVFLKNGERILKSPESWTTARYVEEINTALAL